MTTSALSASASRFHGIAETVQRADARIAAPRENELVDAAHADELVVDQVRRHADQGQMLAALPYDLVAGGMRNKMGEAFQRHRVAVANGVLDGFGQRRNMRHERLASRLRLRIYGGDLAGSNGAMALSWASNGSPMLGKDPIFTLHAELEAIINLGLSLIHI